MLVHGNQLAWWHCRDGCYSYYTCTSLCSNWLWWPQPKQSEPIEDNTEEGLDGPVQAFYGAVIRRYRAHLCTWMITPRPSVYMMLRRDNCGVHHLCWLPLKDQQRESDGTLSTENSIEQKPDQRILEVASWACQVLTLSNLSGTISTILWCSPLSAAATTSNFTIVWILANDTYKFKYDYYHILICRLPW